jgi:hypothetical protein
MAFGGRLFQIFLDQEHRCLNQHIGASGIREGHDFQSCHMTLNLGRFSRWGWLFSRCQQKQNRSGLSRKPTRLLRPG